ncbi:unnamed protein product, partial [Amoebophrya sp. A25]
SSDISSTPKPLKKISCSILVWIFRARKETRLVSVIEGNETACAFTRPSRITRSVGLHLPRRPKAFAFLAASGPPAEKQTCCRSSSDVVEQVVEFARRTLVAEDLGFDGRSVVINEP